MEGDLEKLTEGWGGGAYASGECGMERTLVVKIVLPERMHQQTGWEGGMRGLSSKGTTGKGGERGTTAKQQRAAGEIAVEVGDRRRRRRRRCRGCGLLRARVGSLPSRLRSQARSGTQEQVCDRCLLRRYHAPNCWGHSGTPAGR